MSPTIEIVIGAVIILATIVASFIGHKKNKELIDGFHYSGHYNFEDEEGKAVDRILDAGMWGCLSIPFIGVGIILILHGLSR